MLCSQTSDEDSENKDIFTACSFKIKPEGETKLQEVLNFLWFVPGNNDNVIRQFTATNNSEDAFGAQVLRKINSLWEEGGKIQTQKMLSKWCHSFITSCFFRTNMSNSDAYYILSLIHI